MKPGIRRRIVNADLGGRIREIVFRTPWYTMVVNSTSKRVEFKKAVPRHDRTQKMAVVREAVGGTFTRTVLKPSQVTKADRKLEVKSALSYMETHWEDRLIMQGRYVYQFDCHCGGRIILTADEALDRDDLGLGCGRKSCRAPTFDRQIWYRPPLALLLQFRQLREQFPEKLTKFEAPFDAESVVTALMEDRKLVNSIRDGRYWVSEVADSEHLLQDRLILGYTPDPDLFPGGNVMVKVGAWSVEINELCEAYGFDLDRALYRLLDRTDPQLLNEMIGEQP